MLTLRSVPFGLKVFVGLTQVAVSTTLMPYCFSVIFKSSQVSSLYCARVVIAADSETNAARIAGKNRRVNTGRVLLMNLPRILAPQANPVNRFILTIRRK